MIDSDRPFTVKKQFMASKEGDDFTAIWQIVTTLSQEGYDVVLEQNCDELPDFFTNALDANMALSLSRWDSDESASCTVELSDHDSSSLHIGVFEWTDNDSIYEEADEVILMGPSDSLEDCVEEGCTQCLNAYTTSSPDDVFQVCNCTMPMKYVNACPTNSQNWARTGNCNALRQEHCMKAYPFGDPLKLRSKEASCKTIPMFYLDEEDMMKGSKNCKSQNGICPTCEDG